jgi:predicted O-methyltransferase YrrM
MEQKTGRENMISSFIAAHMKPCKVANAAVFNILRTLKQLNPGDAYYEAYLGHWAKQGDKFFDYYHLLWAMGSHLKIDRALEIGCRTGISACQLLSSMKRPGEVKLTLCDLFGDGFLSPEIVKMNMRHLNIPTDNVEFKIGSSLDIVPQLEGTFDYILVDGDHSRDTAIKDLENVVRLCHSGTIILFDDIAEDGVSLDCVWQEFKQRHNEFDYYQNYDGKGCGVGVFL